MYIVYETKTGMGDSPCLLPTWPGLVTESPAGQDEMIPTRTSTSENLKGEVCFPK